MAKFDIKTVKPKFVVTTSPENKIDVVVNKPIIESKNSKSFFQLKNTGGPRGLKGDKGDTGTISVASTTTGAPGTNASVENVGTPTDAQLAFTIPRGDKGDKGDPGEDGFTPTAWVTRYDNYAQINIKNKNTLSVTNVYDGTNGTDGFSPIASVSKAGDTATITITDKEGTTTASVSDGTDGQDGAAATIAVGSTTTGDPGTSASVVNSGTSSAAVFDFTIPKGDTGAAGADGDAATITVGTVETLQPNQSAYVTNVGTTSAAIFNIGIPKGEKGESGSGSGDMLSSDYDPNSTVKNAGGIPDYVSGQLPGDMTGATSSTAGAHGLVPAPAAGDQGKALMGDGTWKALPSAELVEMSYGESNAWAKFIAAYNAHCVVYCRASSNANPATGSQTRKAFMAYVNNADAPTSVEFQYYRSVSSHSDSQQGDQVFVYTLTNASGGTWSVTTRNTFSKVVAGTNMTSSYSSGTLTLNATQPTVPTKTSDLTNDSGFITGADLPTKTSDLTNDGSDGTSTYVEADELGAAAFSNEYSDLNNTPTIPTVNDATLTIQHNGTNVQTFTANQSTNATANIETIWADDIEATTPVPAVETAMIADGAVTSAKIADGTIATGDIANSAVTNAKIANNTIESGKMASGVLEYKAGDTITLNSGDYHYFAGRTRTSGSNKYVWFFVQLDKPIQSGRSVTFTPSGYQEVFGPSGTIISRENPSTSVMTFTVWVSSQSRSCIQMQMNILDGTSITGNLCCSVHIGGVFTIS